MDISLSTKAMSVVSVTSQCSYSSTIVHVPQPESGTYWNKPINSVACSLKMITGIHNHWKTATDFFFCPSLTEATALEDAPMGSEPAETTQTPTRPAPSPPTEERKLVGLTKEVLSAHTQKEEEEYVDRFQHRILQSPYSSYLQLDNSSMAHSHQPGRIFLDLLFAYITLLCIHLTTGDYIYPLSVGEWIHSRRGKSRHKRPKPRGSSDSYASPGPKSSWPSSESSQPQIGVGVAYSQTSPPQASPYSTMAAQPGAEQALRPQQLPGAIPMLPPDQNQFTYNFGVIEREMQPIQMEPIQNFPSLQPMAPVQSLQPYMTPVIALILPNYPALTPGFPSVYPPSASSMLPQAPINMAIVPGSTHFPPPLFRAQPTPQPQTTLGPLLCSPGASSSVGDEEEAAGPPALFSSSRSSSPLQLNLLQEELPKPNEEPGSTGHNYSESLHDQHVNEVGRVDGHCSPSTGSNLCESFSH